MSFGVIQITNQGRALQAKALTGIPLNFTRIAVGDGQLSGQVIAELNGLINEVQSITLNTLKTLPRGKAKIGGVLSNQGLANGFYWRELGVFADDPDLGEILYCYGNAGALAEYIPGPNGSEILERQINVITIVGDAPNVSATIDQSLVFATHEDINEAIYNHEQNDYATLDNFGHVKHAVLTATLDTTWEGEEAPYTKTITVNGIQATDMPIIDVVMSGDYATDEQRVEAWGYIYRAVTGTNSITFYATEKPTIDLPIQIKVVR